jgi:hypothetical protein
MSFGKKGNRVQANRTGPKPAGERPPEDVVRDLKAGLQRPPGEDYRDRSLAIHGLICARCAREFDASNQHLLTVHHRDGNHHYNPPDGSNWENLCVYCHDDAHSAGCWATTTAAGARERHLVRSAPKGRSGRSGSGEASQGPRGEGEKRQIAECRRRLTRSGQSAWKCLDFRECL